MGSENCQIHQEPVGEYTPFWAQPTTENRATFSEQDIQEITDSWAKAEKQMFAEHIFDESEPETEDNFREMTFRRWLELHDKPDIVAGTMY